MNQELSKRRISTLVLVYFSCLKSKMFRFVCSLEEIIYVVINIKKILSECVNLTTFQDLRLPKLL